MQALTTIDTAALCPKDISKTTLSLTTGSNSSTSSSLIALSSTNERNQQTNNKNMLSFYKLGNNNKNQQQQEPIISFRHQFELDSREITDCSTVTATTVNHPQSKENEMWVACGGKSAKNNNVPALWFGPVLGSSERSLSNASTVMPLPTSSSSSSSAKLAHLNFLSASSLAMATSDGRVGLFDLGAGRMTTPMNPVPAVSGGMRPTCLIPAEDSNSFFLVTGRLIARIDARMKQQQSSESSSLSLMNSHISRPAQFWLWHPHDKISAINFDAFTSSRELICGSEEGTLMLFDTRASSSNSNIGSSHNNNSNQGSSSSSSPWQVNPRPGCAISGVGRVDGGNSICVSWNDTLIGAVDVITSPNSETKSTMRTLVNSESRNASSSALAISSGKHHHQDAAASSSQQNHPTLSTPAHEFVHDSAVCGSNSGSIVLAQDRNIGIVGTRRGKLTVVGYRS